MWRRQALMRHSWNYVHIRLAAEHPWMRHQLGKQLNLCAASVSTTPPLVPAGHFSSWRPCVTLADWLP